METFLELFSEDNFDAYCLAYMFTYRDFEGGTLGLAWTGDLTNAGGVCERNGVSKWPSPGSVPSTDCRWCLALPVCGCVCVSVRACVSAYREYDLKKP